MMRHRTFGEGWGIQESTPRKFHVQVGFRKTTKKSQARGMRRGHWLDHILGSGRDQGQNPSTGDNMAVLCWGLGIRGWKTRGIVWWGIKGFKEFEIKFELRIEFRST